MWFWKASNIIRASIQLNCEHCEDIFFNLCFMFSATYLSFVHNQCYIKSTLSVRLTRISSVNTAKINTNKCRNCLLSAFSRLIMFAFVLTALISSEFENKKRQRLGQLSDILESLSLIETDFNPLQAKAIVQLRCVCHLIYLWPIKKDNLKLFCWRTDRVCLYEKKPIR